MMMMMMMMTCAWCCSRCSRRARRSTKRRSNVNTWPISLKPTLPRRCQHSKKPSRSSARHTTPILSPPCSSGRHTTPTSSPPCCPRRLLSASLISLLTVEYCDPHVCLFVCLLAYLKDHTSKFYQISLYMFLVAVARFFSDGSAICYVFQFCG